MIDQTSQFLAILTAVGEAKQANADALGVPWRITHMGVGDANGTDPIPDRLQTALIHERRRAPLNQLTTDEKNPGLLIAEQVIPADVGGWWVREVGLYDADGDLVAVSNCAPSYKPLLTQGSGRTQVVRMTFIISSTANVVLKIDPSVVLASREYVDLTRLKILTELATPFVNLDASHKLRPHEMGLVLINASAANLSVQLPPADNTLGTRDVVLRRTDNSGNRLEIRASDTDKIKFHTHLNPDGYGFLVLMGAGDWWHLRSDAKGGWWPIGRFDETALGRPILETAINFPPGGYGALNGSMFVRADWPWLWDHAQQSSMLVSEAQRSGNEGCWTSGDGLKTFRGPESRGEFFRVLDEVRGIDGERNPGSWQDGTWIRTVAQEWTGSDISTGIHHIGTAFAAADGHIHNGGPGGTLPPGALAPSGAPFNPNVTDNTIRGTAEIDTLPINHWIRLRPRNIAYPGRIKLI